MTRVVILIFKKYFLIMISLDELRNYYPPGLKGWIFNQHMIKEYLLTIILNYISKSVFTNKLTFNRGTSLRFCHGLARFSEDLDFDYSGKNREELRPEFDEIVKKVNLEGIQCELQHNYKKTDNFAKIIFNNLAQYYDLGDPRKKCG